MFQASLQSTPWSLDRMDEILHPTLFRQNGCQFPDIFKCIFLNEDISISIRISLKFVLEVPIDNKPPGRHQVIIWTNAGILFIEFLGTNFNEISIKVYEFPFQKKTFQNVIWKLAVSLSQPQCVNSLRPSDAIWQHKSGSPLAQVMAWCRQAMLTFHQ